VGANLADLASDGGDTSEQDRQEANQNEAVVVAGLFDSIALAGGKDELASAVINSDSAVLGQDCLHLEDLGGIVDISADLVDLARRKVGNFSLATGDSLGFLDISNDLVSLDCGDLIGSEIGLGLADVDGGHIGSLQRADDVGLGRGGYSSAHGEDEDRDHEECGEFFHGEGPPVSCY